ncbi:NXPE family member 3-like [Mercenaria mercenaria]|uniref:NXPE family member 3-like n=1 Tax=Mercenaria mercenaria TaxID=6596 RepID=UPI00234F2E06|nr:NXPE family member 3-like [Mercenaria mercenaria]
MNQLDLQAKRSKKRLICIPPGLLLVLTICLILHMGYIRAPAPPLRLPVIYANANIDDVQRQLNELLREYKPFQRCKDSLLAADPRRSKIELKGDHVVNLTETVRLSVILYDGYGRPKTTGGDHLRARLYNNSVDASVPGQVLDHRNGTYTVTIEALWTGWAAVEVEVLFPREIIAAGLRIRTAWNFSDLRANFRNKNSSGASLCNPDFQVLERLYGKSAVCNFSYWNKTLPWFCGKPHVRHLSCKHWVSISRSWHNFTEGISKCEKELSERAYNTIPKKVLIKILPTRSAKSQVTVEQPHITCMDYNTTQLWYKSKPTGYFYKGNWILRHCKGLSGIDGKCLGDKTIYFWGDSTLLQWHNYLLSKLTFSCKIVQNDKHTWRRTTTCFCSKYNITLNWMPHNIPVSPFQVKNPIPFFSNTFGDTVSNVKKGSDVILIVNLYAHIQMYPLKYFAVHIVEIRKMIETIFEKVYNVRVFIKLPHTFREIRHKKWKIVQPSYIGIIYTDIMRNVFKGLYQKVIVLDNKDATIAIGVSRLHPAPKVVKAMINQLLSYICNEQK